MDSVASSHPISLDVNDPDEISEIFDGITYGKGGSVIRMASYFLGNDTFFRGITVNILLININKYYLFLKEKISKNYLIYRNILINMFIVMPFKTIYGTH